MKKISFLCFVLLVLIACNQRKKTKQVTKSTTKEKVSTLNEDLENAVIYEANIRQYSKEGSLKAFTKDIPQLKELGVKILWLMPIYPISSTKSKGSLGSYYAVTDYTKVNPEFGTLEDLKNLIKVAHENKIYVILDWVPNHTGWDHIWLKEHKDFYTQNDKGEVIIPKGTDWTDVADLNYDNKEMRKEMLKDMKYWLKEVDIDGFRCDMAGMVPFDFWKETITELRKEKPIFMLAEGWEPELLINGFDMGYSWDTHHRMNDIAKGKKDVTAWDKRMAKIDSLYQKEDILMNFVTNHDENSWNGTVKERMGDASELFTALTYVTPGMPLIYSGQEYGLNHRLKFFEKDEIPHTKAKEWELLKKLGKLKNDNIALNGGKNKASYTRIVTNNKNVLAFTRSKNGQTVVFVGNLSDKPQEIKEILKGSYTNYMSGKSVVFPQKMKFKPWEYLVLVKE
ncbi:MAG: alpha-amylase [Flavobacteriaceae bacterium]|nr:alpha-amylase [Flavobacteriaceae bacterium]